MHSLRFLPRSLLAAAILIPASLLRAQSDDFEDGNDAGWTQYAPLAALGGTTYTVADGKYTLSCQPSPSPATTGPSRCGSLRQGDVYTDFLVMVDILDFNPADDTSTGILARIQPNPGPAATNGYAFTYQSTDHDVQISRLDSEAPTDISGTPDIMLETGKSYRMVFFGIGSRLEGRIYDLATPLTPLIIATANDGAWTQGTCGLVVFSNDNLRAHSSFDNYAATDGSLPPPDIEEIGGGVNVSWDTAAGLAHSLYQSNDLTYWFLSEPLAAADGRTSFFVPFDVEFPSRYFRLRLGPEPIGAAP